MKTILIFAGFYLKQLLFFPFFTFQTLAKLLQYVIFATINYRYHVLVCSSFPIQATSRLGDL
jgi:hypothetical protein